MPVVKRMIYIHDRKGSLILQLYLFTYIVVLQEAGVEVDPFGDLNTEAERKLGQLVFEKYVTSFVAQQLCSTFVPMWFDMLNIMIGKIYVFLSS